MLPKMQSHRHGKPEWEEWIGHWMLEDVVYTPGVQVAFERRNEHVNDALVVL